MALKHISPLPQYTWDRRTQKLLEEMQKKWPDRVERGMELMLLATGVRLVAYVKQADPRIDGINYDNLRVVTAPDVSEWKVAAVVMEDKEDPLDDEEINSTVLYISPSKSAPQVVRFLASFNPWPARLLTVPIIAGQGEVVARLVTLGEVNRRERQILAQKNRIESSLRRMGARVRIQQSDAQVGANVKRDLAFKVLRHEFGVMAQQRAHWRPATRRVVDDLGELADALVQFIITGRESVFDTPSQRREVSIKDLKALEPFQERIVKG